jgi:TP901 family phage tail tape measure protein
MAVSLKLADAYIDISVDMSKFAADLSKVKSMLGALGGGGVAQGMAAGIAAGVAQGVAQGGGQARNALGQFASQGVAQGVAAGMAQGVAGARGSAAPLGAAVQQAVAQGMAAGAARGGGQARDALGRFTAGPGGGAGGGPGFGASFGAGALQGLGLSGFATNPAMALGSMAGGGIKAGWGLIAEGIKESAATAMDLQSTFLDLQRVTGGSAENVGRLKTAVFDIANRQAGVSVSDVTGIMMGAAKAGVGEKEGDAGLIRFTQGIARIKNAMGEGEGLNADQLTNDTTKILTVFGLGTEKVEGFGSALVRMANISTASGADIVQMTRTLSGTFKSLDVDVGMAMAISSVITDVGLTNQQGANAMSQFLRNMASGSAEMAEKIGMPVEQFQTKIRTDAIGAFQLVLEKFKEINAVDPIKGQEFVKGLGYEGIRAAGAFQQLSSMVDDMQNRARIAREEMGSLAALTEADALKSEAAAGSVLRLANAFTQLKDAIGENFLGPISAGTAALTDLTRAAAGNMPAIVAGVGTAGKAVAGAVGGAPATAAMAGAPWLSSAASVAMGWLGLGGETSAPAIPGKATGMVPRAESPADVRARMLADVEAENERRRAMAGARPGAAALIAAMAEDIGGVGNLLNAPSRFREAGGLAGWGTGMPGLAQWGPANAEANKHAEELMTLRERREEREFQKKQGFQPQMFTDPADYATHAIQAALKGDDTPKLTLKEIAESKKILADISAKIVPTGNPLLPTNNGPLIFRND